MIKMENQGDRHGPDRQQAWRDKKLITVLFVKKIGVDVTLVLTCKLDALRLGFCLNCIILLTKRYIYNFAYFNKPTYDTHFT